MAACCVALEAMQRRCFHGHVKSYGPVNKHGTVALIFTEQHCVALEAMPLLLPRRLALNVILAKPLSTSAAHCITPPSPRGEVWEYVRYYARCVAGTASCCSAVLSQNQFQAVHFL